MHVQETATYYLQLYFCQLGLISQKCDINCCAERIWDQIGSKPVNFRTPFATLNKFSCCFLNAWHSEAVAN